LTDEISLVETGCMGPCQFGPMMVTYPDGSFYINLKEEHAAQIVEEHFLKGRPVRPLLWLAPEARKIVEEKKQIPFFEKQLKIVWPTAAGSTRKISRNISPKEGMRP